MRHVIPEVSVFNFMAGFVNVFLLETSDGLMLIDTGMSGNMMDTIAADLSKHGRSVEDIRHIFITHAHVDHIGGLAHMQTLTNAHTYAHRREAAIIRGEAQVQYARPEDLGFLGRTFGSRMLSTSPIPPARVDSEVKEGDPILDVFEVIELPGHAYGHIGLLWPEKKVLFGGDTVFNLPWGFTKPLAPATPDMPEAIRSIKKAAALDIDTLCICHGSPVVEDTSAKLRKFAARFN